MSFPGALVISLDFELHWGVCSTVQGEEHPYMEDLRGTPAAVEQILQIFDQYQVAATWATVGFLFARSLEERKKYDPRLKPTYLNPKVDTYQVPTGKDYKEDPLHYAPDLIEKIRKTPGQELASHTYSHYFPLEAGQTLKQFEADLESACRIAEANGVELKSIVFPKNMINTSYLKLLNKYGFKCYRGNENGWMYPYGRSSPEVYAKSRKIKKFINPVGRYIDSYFPIAGNNLVSWESIEQPNGLYNIAGSYFLRPWTPRFRYLSSLQLIRIKRAMKRAAQAGKIFHLWWHPHNFGRYKDENLALLHSILKYYQILSDKYDMKTYTMYDVVKTVNRNI